MRQVASKNSGRHNSDLANRSQEPSTVYRRALQVTPSISVEVAFVFASHQHILLLVFVRLGGLSGELQEALRHDAQVSRSLRFIILAGPLGELGPQQ